MRAHPRSRGENQRRAEEQLALAGSSPLTRGKLACTTYRARCIGLIPAHAGKTRNALRIEDPRRAHPRSRGENDPAYRWVDADGGSSPLTRGKLRDSACERLAERLIPAHAGKTGRVGVGLVPGDGSSPLTRGKRCEGGLERRGAGLIPAHAGKTFTALEKIAFTPAHPRSRGENRMGAQVRFNQGGSSPLTRGKPCFCLLFEVRGAAHPRSRGENRSVPVMRAPIAGSSPLTRGKHSRCRPCLAQGGLIPAHAGKTVGSRALRGHTGAHPRSRGENRTTPCGKWATPGSSPLTRGKRF